MSNWFVAVDGKSLGPFTTQMVLSGLASGQYNEATMVWRDGFADWQPAGRVDELKAGPTMQAPPPSSGKEAHEIEYTIFGNEMQFVEIELDPQESVISEAGAMMYMHDQIAMETIFGDGSNASSSGTFFDKMLGAGKRLITGEGFFFANLRGPGHVWLQSLPFSRLFAGRIWEATPQKGGGGLDGGSMLGGIANILKR